MRIALVAAIAGLSAACGLVGESTGGKAVTKADAVFEGPVPRATCGGGSQPELGVQGRVPTEDRVSGRSQHPYSCNLEVVGQAGDGANWQQAWYEDCAYYSTAQGGGEGVQVVDVKDPSHPVIANKLQTNAMLDPWESLKANEKRGLIGAVGPGAISTLYFDVYDVKADCTRPQLLASLPVDGIGHEGNWAPDGNTYYGAALFAPEIMAIDTTNPSAPRPIMPLPYITHGLDVSPDGNRLYLAVYLPKNGLEIYDSTLLQTREPYPARAPVEPVLLGSVYWTDGATAQHPIPVKIGGKPYVIFVDEGGVGMARIIDVSDETAPQVIAKLKLEIDMPDAAELRTADADGSDGGSFAYNGHYCGVDSREDAQVVACSYFWSGVRVFDIRDPYHPKEIAYYNPGGTQATAVTQQTPGPATAGYTSAQVRFVKRPDGGGEIWFTDQRHGFYVAKFSNGVWPFRE